MKARIQIGRVVSARMKKTIVVCVEERTRNRVFGKFSKKVRKFKVHDEKNECQVGDVVQIRETRPISKEKRWQVHQMLVKGASVEAVSA